ncbi:MAG: hypothetical protein RBR28_10485 [Lentimicrobium sp.]|jgi:uncharacterized protein involved in exopolysaccharide biosynthesis|nr:hypothetical protein [Lentimicrobium sp.]
MMSEYKPTRHKDFDSTNLGTFLYAWRKHLVVIGLVAAILAIIFSTPYFITPLYRSTVVLFPVSSNSISRALLNEQPSAKSDILEFGEDEQTEQMLQILSSSKIRDRVVYKYDLLKHYKINPSSKYKNTELFRQWESNITFRRTDYMAVKIAVLDRDPQMAADIANTISELHDSIKNEMQRERAVRGFEIVKNEYLKLQRDIAEMEDSLRRIREKGVYDYESQSEMINRQLAIEIARGNRSGINALEEQLTLLAKYGGAYVSLRDMLEHEKKQLSYLKARYEEAQVDATETLPQKFVVESAYKAERKSYPVRWIIVLVSTLSALMLSAIVILIIEKTGNQHLLKKKPSSLGEK